MKRLSTRWLLCSTTFAAACLAACGSADSDGSQNSLTGANASPSASARPSASAGPTASPSPTPPPQAVSVVAPPTTSPALTAVGVEHSCAIKQGNIYCWGSNDFGQIGSPAAPPPLQIGSNQLTPLRVDSPNGVSFVKIAAVASSTVALSSSGAVYRWGNVMAEAGGTFDRTKPVVANVLPTGVFAADVAISSGTGETTPVVLGSDGQVYAYGSNFFGQLGLGTKTTDLLNDSTKTPQRALLPAGVRAISLAASGSVTCVLASTGEPYCWGGVQDLANYPEYQGPLDLTLATPYKLAWPANETIAHMAVVGSSAYFTTSTGSLYVWKAPSMFPPGTPIQVPTSVTLPAGVTARATFTGACFTTPQGELYCPADASPHAYESVLLPGGTSVTSFARVGGSMGHSCVTTTSQDVLCWGGNTWGELGDGTTHFRSTPLAVAIP